MKRALTGIAAAAVVLGTAAPMAFAATSSGLTKAGQLPIVVNGSVLSNPYEMTGKDSGNTTAYFPVYYFDQALTKIGYTASWDGVTHTWAITAPGVDASTVASSISGGVGTGNTTITVNGTVVKKINTKAAKDPAASKSAAATTYFPAYYIDEIFNSLGANVSFSGQTGLKIVGQTSSTPILSAITVSGATMGTGSQSSPAVETGSGSLSASTTLTDENGNPVAGINVTFNVWGESTAPNVTSGGLTISPASSTAAGTSSSPFAYTVTTNASGVASISLNDGSNAAYTIQAQAPYSNNGITVTSSKSYIAFGQPGSLILSPVGTDTAGFSTTSTAAGLVPVTATLIPTVSGASVANIPVQFNFSQVQTSAAGATPVTYASLGTPFVSDANGNYVQPITADGDSGSSATEYTNASGQAVLYVNANTASNLAISANATVDGVQVNGSNVITWTQQGTATQIKNTPTSSTTAPIAGTINTNLTISGTVEDALGNPVPNTQILVSGNDSGNNDLSYVSGSTSTTFPNVGTGTLSGADANSDFGQVLTTDANGNFTITVKDSKAEQAQLQVYAISGGQISSALGAPYYLSFENSSTGLNALYVDTTTSGLTSSSTSGATTTYSANDEDTSLTGLGYQEGGSASEAPVYVGAFSNSTPYQSGTVQYTVSGNNKGYVAAIDGVPLNGTQSLPNQPSSAVVDVTYSSNVVTEVTVDGVAIYNHAEAGTGTASAGGFDENGWLMNNNTGTSTSPSWAIASTVPTSALTASTSATSAFNFVPGDSNVENDTFTVATGSLSDTVGANFTAGQPAELGNAGSYSIGAGQSQTINFTVEDSNGNPVAGSAVYVKPAAAASDLWITAVNGATLAQNEYGTDNTNYGTQPTPIPLYTPAADTLGYTSVYQSGQVSAMNVGESTQTVQVYSDSDGKVSITFTAGGNGYWPYSGTQPVGAPEPTGSNVVYFSYDGSGNIVVTPTTAPSKDVVGSLTYTGQAE